MIYAPNMTPKKQFSLHSTCKYRNKQQSILHKYPTAQTSTYENFEMKKKVLQPKVLAEKFSRTKSVSCLQNKNSNFQEIYHKKISATKIISIIEEISQFLHLGPEQKRGQTKKNEQKNYLSIKNIIENMTKNECKSTLLQIWQTVQQEQDNDLKETKTKNFHKKLRIISPLESINSNSVLQNESYFNTPSSLSHQSLSYTNLLLNKKQNDTLTKQKKTIINIEFDMTDCLKELEKLRADNSALKDNKQKMQNNLSKLMDSTLLLNEEIDGLETQNNQLCEEISILKAKSKEKDFALQAFQKKNQQLSQKCTQKSQSQDQLEDKIAKLQQIIFYLNSNPQIKKLICFIESKISKNDLKPSKKNQYQQSLNSIDLYSNTQIEDIKKQIQKLKIYPTQQNYNIEKKQMLDLSVSQNCESGDGDQDLLRCLLIQAITVESFLPQKQSNEYR